MPKIYTQTFDIQPMDLVLGGHVMINVDLTTGAIITRGTAQAGKWSFKKSFPLDSKAKLAQKELLFSKNLHAGQKLDLGTVVLTVERIADGLAVCSVVVKSGDVQLTGHAWIDVKGELIHINRIDAAGVVAKLPWPIGEMNARLVLTEAAHG